MKKRFQPLFALIILFTGCSASKSAADVETRGREQIPSMFNPNKGILLIVDSVAGDKSRVDVSMANSYQTDNYMNALMGKNRKNMAEHVEKNYPYKYQFASQGDIYSPETKYNDKTLYQFALVASLGKPDQYYKMETNGQFNSTHYQPIFTYYLYDRLNNKTYAALGRGSSLIMWAFKDAIKKLKETKR
jgi:hypothetical protein